MYPHLPWICIRTFVCMWAINLPHDASKPPIRRWHFEIPSQYVDLKVSIHPPLFGRWAMPKQWLESNESKRTHRTVLAIPRFNCAQEPWKNHEILAAQVTVFNSRSSKFIRFCTRPMDWQKENASLQNSAIMQGMSGFGSIKVVAKATVHTLYGSTPEPPIQSTDSLPGPGSTIVFLRLK